MKRSAEAMGDVLREPLVFGQYALVERIGRGGMADVFKARMLGTAGFERTVVVKRILPRLCADPSFTRMLIREAKLAAKLTHPNIVQVFELGQVGHEHFVSMEYVHGRTLAELVRTLWKRTGPPRPELVAFIGREMCRALAHAHDYCSEDGQYQGIIHRDISPSNVMISFDGAVKIVDFGIAKAALVHGSSRESEEDKTQVGMLKGKLAYLAPEQLVRQDIDWRVDIFATGVVLHEALTGQRLFKGESESQTLERVRRCAARAPSSRNPLCPSELDRIVLHAIAKRPEQRYQAAADMAYDLDEIVHRARFGMPNLAHVMRSLFATRSRPDGVSMPGREREAGLGPAEPDRGKACKPFQAFHIRTKSAMSPELAPAIVSGPAVVPVRGSRGGTESNPIATPSPMVPPAVLASPGWPSRPAGAGQRVTRLLQRATAFAPVWVLLTGLCLLGLGLVGGAMCKLHPTPTAPASTLAPSPASSASPASSSFPPPGPPIRHPAPDVVATAAPASDPVVHGPAPLRHAGHRGLPVVTKRRHPARASSRHTVPDWGSLGPFE